MQNNRKILKEKTEDTRGKKNSPAETKPHRGLARENSSASKSGTTPDEPGEGSSTVKTKVSETPEKNHKSEVLDLRKELKKKCEEVEKSEKALLYEKAELDNFRKRIFKEKSELRKYIQNEILLDFLPVVDNLERAVEHAGVSSSKDAIEEGIAMTLILFRDIFGQYGVKDFESLGKQFDPTLHEAMSREENSDVEGNTITQEFLKGYKINDKLLRPAQVVVSYKPEKVDENGPMDLNATQPIKKEK